MAVKIPRSASPPWAVRAGQSRTAVRPPVTIAAARKGPAFDRSASTVTSPSRGVPGSTVHRAAGRPGRAEDGRPAGEPSPTRADTAMPAARRTSTVMAMCGLEGTGGPTCRRSRPRSMRGAARSRAETNWEEAEASISTLPPSTEPVPWTVTGRTARPEASAACSTSTPRSRSARTTGSIGRVRAAGSPSTVTSPTVKAATAGMKRMTVPASPAWILAEPSGPGVSVRVRPSWDRAAPMPARPRAMRTVSRAMRGRWMRAGSSPSAARTR